MEGYLRREVRLPVRFIKQIWQKILDHSLCPLGPGSQSTRVGSGICSRSLSSRQNGVHAHTHCSNLWARRSYSLGVLGLPTGTWDRYTWVHAGVILNAMILESTWETSSSFLWMSVSLCMWWGVSTRGLKLEQAPSFAGRKMAQTTVSHSHEE